MPGKDPIKLAITDTLDLHLFQPKEIATLINDYLSECQKRGILTVRIIHGKGTGTLRTTVHKILSQNPSVIRFNLAGEASGGWGATYAYLSLSPS